MSFDIILIIIAGICMVVGVIGCVLPVLPGPVMCYAGLILVQLTSARPFTTLFLVIFALLTGIAALLDYLIPVYGTKKFRGSKYGVWGSAAGLLLGLVFFFPLGILLGPVIGAFIGELISGKTLDRAVKSALGSFSGFLAGTAMKLVLSAAMTYYYVIYVIQLF